ncbi:phosphotransferase family protein [Dongia sp.]|uniref:phosphotransferase family protein n=1 Tax=Dongia sp. TaxID=1977262 RepID=UPI003751975F
MFDPVAFVVEQGLTRNRDLRADALTGGYLNQVFRLRGPGIDWVVKRFLPETELALFPNLPEPEHRAMSLAHQLGLAPKPVAFIDQPELTVLVYEYVEGEMWRSGIADVARMLKRLRAADPTGFRAVPMTPKEILEEGEAFLPRMEPEMRARLVASKPKPIAIDRVPQSFLHTDIGPGNIIVTPERQLVVIDWQCPAAGDAVQDVIAFLSPAFQILYGCPIFSNAQETEFFAAYDDPDLEERYAQLRPFYDWRMAGYCATRADKYALSRPAAAENYILAHVALMERLA